MNFPARRASALIACLGALLIGLPGAHASADPGPAIPGAAATKATPPVPLPAHPDGLPAPGDLGDDIDPAAGYQPQLGCAAKAMPGTVRLRALALKTYGRGGTSPATPRACTTGSASEHKDGRAWDWMLNHANKADRRVAADFIGWLVGKGTTGETGEMAARLGVMYVIYNRKIWSSYSPGWRDYTGADPHTSHIHISLSWNGARAHTSFWTGRTWPTDYGVCQVFEGQPANVVTPHPRTRPCPAAVPSPLGSSRALAWLGSSGDNVSDGQRLLGIADTGGFDRTTRKAVIAYQKAHDLPRTGALDKPTWASLDPATAQRNVPSWTPGAAATWARNNGSPVVARGVSGKVVYALQTALRLDPASRTGFYGAGTRAAVLAFKQDHGLPRTGRVDAAVWDLLPQPAT